MNRFFSMQTTREGMDVSHREGSKYTSASSVTGWFGMEDKAYNGSKVELPSAGFVHFCFVSYFTYLHVCIYISHTYTILLSLTTLTLPFVNVLYLYILLTN